MNFLYGITTLLVFQLIGEVCALVLKLPIPGPVLGMFFLFLTLLFRRRSTVSLNDSSSALLNHLPLLFVPAGVGVIVHFELIGRQWLAISLTLILSTTISIVFTALIMLGAGRVFGKKHHD